MRRASLPRPWTVLWSFGVPYLDYLGAAMPESAAPQTFVNGSATPNMTYQAPAGPSAVTGGASGDILIGSSGDNIFYIDAPNIQVVEQLNGGVDTEIAYTSVVLAPNVENLTVHGDFNSAVGNSQANLIIVDGRQWVYGGGGDDVLVGSATQTTTFVEKAGDGNDVIYNWNSNDQLQLLNYGLTTPAQIRGAMSQVGSDVVLHLSSREALTFRNVTEASFQDRQFLLPLDTTKLGAATFDDEFSTLSLANPATGGGVWETNFGGNLKDQQAYTLTANGEQEAYVAPGFQGQGVADLKINPFSIANGVLTITALPTPAADLHAAYGLSYTSGLLNTLDTFQQKYGYFEVRAAVPTAQGAWPAFWMLPHPFTPNVEGDIFEALGSTPNVDYRRAYGGSQTLYDNALKIDPTGFHSYGMLWTASTVSFYLDGIEVLSGATPSTWTQPMALLLNLAVGGFGGAPQAAQFPATLQVDYVRAYALADGSSLVQRSAPTAPVDTFHDDGAASGQKGVALNYSDGSGPLYAGQIEALAAKPGVPPAARAFVIWEDAGAVFGAVSNGAALASPTGLGAFSSNPFTGAGAWLTDGKVAAGYLQANDSGGQDAWALVFDPTKLTFLRQDLGPSIATNAGGLHFVATQDGGFAVSWTAPDGTASARGYDEYAYGGDTPGWYGPVAQVAGALIGVTADGHLIAASGPNQELYDLMGASTVSSASASAAASTIAAEVSLVLRAASPAAAALESQLVAEISNGTTTQAAVVTQIVQAAAASSSVASLSYAFFTGKTPTAAGMDYLVSPSGPNANNLNSAYYQSFSLENRYINFAVNLGKLGEGAAKFAASYGGLDLFDATRQAYTSIFGGAPSDAKIHALLDPTFELNGVSMTRATYFAYYGGDGADGTGAKAAMVGWLLAEAEKADIGTYALSNDAFLTDVALHNAPFGVDLVGQYSQPNFAYHPG
jgi:beta-glucanase (GH16 family)